MNEHGTWNECEEMYGHTKIQCNNLIKYKCRCKCASPVLFLTD